MELKLRGLPVSGTKTDLIERLKPYQEIPSSQAATAMELTGHTGAPQPESMSSTPPVSPAPSEVSSLGMEEAGMPGALSPARPTPSGSSPQQGRLEDSPMETRTSEKDQRLHEKERQIEELMRKLEQEQRLVEELKMQLEVEKTQPLQGPSTDPVPMIQTSNKVKLEDRVLPNCSAMVTSIMAPQTHPHSLPTVVKLEDVLCNSQPQPPHQPYLTPTLPQFFISHQGAMSQVVGQPGTQTLLAAQDGTTQILMPVLQATISNQAPGLIQASVPQLHTTKMETRQASTQQQILNHNHMLQVSHTTPGPVPGKYGSETCLK